MSVPNRNEGQLINQSRESIWQNRSHFLLRGKTQNTNWFLQLHFYETAFDTHRTIHHRRRERFIQNERSSRIKSLAQPLILFLFKHPSLKNHYGVSIFGLIVLVLSPLHTRNNYLCRFIFKSIYVGWLTRCQDKLVAIRTNCDTDVPSALLLISSLLLGTIFACLWEYPHKKWFPCISYWGFIFN